MSPGVYPLRNLEASLQISRHRGYKDALVPNLLFLGMQAYWQGRFDRAVHYNHEGVAVAQDIHDGFNELLLLCDLGREFVDVETTVERLLYVYQYMDAHQQLQFRYDNTGHHKQLHLPTFPHHKPTGSDKQIVPSSTPDFAAVLNEVETLVQLPP